MASLGSAISVLNRTRESVVCSSASLADTLRTRLFGLLGRRGLAEDAGLLLRPCSGVHTFGMGFAIDIVTLDKSSCVLGIYEEIGPWKIRGLGVRTRSVLELPAGQARRCGVQVGDRLEVCARA